MKIVMFGKWPEHEPKGGVDVHIINLVNSLSKLDKINIYMISFSNVSKTILKDKAKIILIKSYFIYYIIPILALIRLSLEIKKIKPDIIHVQGSNISPYLIYTLFLAPRESKKILTVHGIMKIESIFKKGVKANIINIINIIIEKYSITKFTNIIVCSLAMKEILTKMTHSNIHIIPNGIDFKNIQHIEPYYKIKNPSIFFVGRLTKVKGVDILLKAIPTILISIPNVIVYIAGIGDQENELKDLGKKLKINKNIEFLDFLKEDDKFSYIKSTNISVFPSLYEPFGIVILEAMMCGKPIIASRTGGIPYLIEEGKTGLLFEPGNYDELAQKIIFLLKDNRLQIKMGSAGKEKARNFSWDNIALHTQELYYRLINDNK